MKQSILIFSAMLILALSFSLCATAQTQIPASNPDAQITSGNITDARNVNCDMIYNIGPSGSGQLRAIAYDDYSTNTSYVYLEDYTGGTTLITIPGAVDIDIVLGDDLSNPGNDYIAAVVYNSSTAPVMETFSITGTGTGSLSATSTNVSVLPLVVSGASYMPPHIDLYPDPFFSISGFPSLHQFAVTWTEYTPFVGINVYFSNGDLLSLGTFAVPNTITSGGSGYWPDVACHWDYSTNEPYAFVAYMNTNNVDLWEINLNSLATSTTSSINAVSAQKSVRIETMNQYDPSSGLARYQLAYAGYVPGSTYLDMFSYNDLTGNTNLTAPVLGLIGNNIHPAVSAGPGQLFAGGYGNENHSICWLNDGVPYYYSQAIELATGNVSGTYPDYYEVNQNPTPSLFLDPYYAPIAVSSSSNVGGNELLTAWNNNNDIFYKYQGDIGQYKTTSIKNAIANSYKLYPNPASNSLTIAGVKNGNYSIADMTGRILQKGEITQLHNTFDISALTKGMYIISMIENDKTAVLKFIKQ